jgi:AmmeMemoRadiSam system protein A
MAEPLLALTLEQQIQLLKIARLTILHYVSRTTMPNLEESDERLHSTEGVFVSLHIGDRLRGCIGRFDGDGPLYKTVMEMAVSAAFQDPRFPPLRSHELPKTDVELSILSPLQVVKPKEVEVGRHGLLVSQGRARGTLLPQVATQYEWSREEFLGQTCEKGGLEADAWKDDDCVIQVFTADVFSESEMRESR